jgi:hypothetical protein
MSGILKGGWIGRVFLEKRRLGVIDFLIGIAWVEEE